MGCPVSRAPTSDHRARGSGSSAGRSAAALQSTDAELLAQIAAGELDALGAIFDRHAADVHRFVSRIAPREDADDVVQETFLRVARVAAGFDGRAASARSWILGVAHAVVRERRRSFARLARVLASFGRVESDRTSPASEGAARELDRALAALDNDKREVVVLCEGLGFTGPEAAQVLGIPVGTVWTRLHHARAALRGFAEGRR